MRKRETASSLFPTFIWCNESSYSCWWIWNASPTFYLYEGEALSWILQPVNDVLFFELVQLFFTSWRLWLRWEWSRLFWRAVTSPNRLLMWSPSWRKPFFFVFLFLASSMVSKSLFPWKIFPWELVRFCALAFIVAGPIVLARKYLEDEDLFFVFNRYCVVL